MLRRNGDDPLVHARLLIATCSGYTIDEPPEILAAALLECIEALEDLCRLVEQLRTV